MTGNTVEQIEFDIAVDKSSAENSLTRLGSLVATLESKVIHLGASFSSMGKTPHAKSLLEGAVADIHTMNSAIGKMRATLKSTGTVDFNNFNKQFKEAVTVLGGMQKGVDGLVITQKKFTEVQKSAQTIDLKRIDYATNLAKIEDRTLRNRQARVNELKIELHQLQKISESADTTLRTKKVQAELEKAIVGVKDQERYLADRALVAKEKAAKLTAQEYVKAVEALALRAKTSTYYNTNNDALTTALGKKRSIVKEEIAYLRVLKDANIGGVLDNQIAKQTLNLRSSIKDMQIQTYKEHAKINTEGNVTQAQLDKQLKAQAALHALKIQEANQQQRSGALSNNALYTLQQNAKVLKEQLAYYESINKNHALDAMIQKTKTDLATNATNQTKAQASAQVSINKQREIALNQLKREEQYNATLTMHAAKRAVGYSVLYTGIAGVTAVVGASIKNFLDADLQMRTLAAVLKVNTERASILSNSIRALGETFGGSLKEIEDVALALARAGIASKDMVPATELVLKMARLTGDTFAESAKAIISFQQVFGDTTSLDTLGNKLAYIANVSRLSTQDIGTFSNYALAAAKSVGMTEDAVGGLAAAFSNAGVNASTIGTEIRTFTGILTSSSEDVKDFFLGLGINQQGLAREVQKGGKASNDAILGFVDTLSKLDKSDFNRLTGNMDKLTTNVLALMRNNKANITEFTRDLEAGAEGQLKQVDTIIAAHQVKLENAWNWILNGSQKFLSDLESGMTDTSIINKIAEVTYKLQGRSSVGSTAGVQGAERAALEEQLKVLKAIQAIKIEEKDLAVLQGKITKATGAEWAALKDQEYTQLKKIGDLRNTIEGTVKVRSKEEIAELQKTKEEYLKTQTEALKAQEAKLKAMEASDPLYTKQKEELRLQQKFVKELTDEVKKLKDESDSIKPINVLGADYDSAGKNIKSKLNAGDILSTSDVKIYNDAINKALANIKQSMDQTFAVQVDKGFGAQVALAKELIGTQGDISRATQEAQVQSTALAALEQRLQDAKKAGDKDQEAAIQAEIDKRKSSTEAFIDMVNSLQELFGKKDTILRDQRDIEEAQAAALEKQIDLSNQLSVAEAKRVAAKSGKTGSNLIGAEVDELKAQLKVAQEIMNASEGNAKDVTKYKELAIKLANKETEQASLANSERERGAKSAERAEERATKKAMEALDLKTKIEIAQAKLNGDTLSQYEIAKKIQEVEKAKADDQDALGKHGEAELTRLNAKLDYQERITAQIQKEADLRVAQWQAQQLDNGVVPTEYANIQQKILEQEQAILKAKQEGADVVKTEKVLIDLRNDAKRIELERTKEIAEVYRQMNLENLQAQSQLITNSVNYNANLTGTAASAQKLAQTLVSTSEKETQYIVEKSNLDKKYQEEAEKYRDNSESSVKALAALKAQKANAQANLDKQYQQNQILGYANIAGAMSGMFEQGSKDAQNFQRIQAALAMVAGIQAILTQGQGDPYSAMPRMLAMAGMVISVLANAKIAFGGIGGVKTTTSSDSLSAIKANTGTGTVLGDSKEQSESIQKALDVLKDYARPEYQLLSSMNKYLSHIASGIGGVSSLLIQEGGFAFGQGFKSTDSGWKNNVGSTASNALSWGALGASGGMGLASMGVAGIGGAALSLIDSLTGGNLDKLISKIPIIGDLNKLAGSFTSKILGGIFGKTSVSSKMKDSGMFFADQLLSEATKNFVGSAYQTVETTTTKKSWFKKSTDVSSKTSTQGLSEQTNRQFTMVIDNLYKTTLLAGEALDTATSTVEDRLKNFVVSIGKVSLYKQSGDQIQKTLEAIFGRLGDQIATTAFPLLRGFQGVGEGMFETMTRVATGMEEAEYYIERLGYQFKDLPYWEIINKSGNVGFEALLQSIVKTDEATYGLNNNLVQVIGSLNSTAEELYGAYTILDGLRGRLQFLSHSIEGISFGMIRGAGSVDALNSGFEAFFENFLTDAEQLSYSTEVITKEFAKLNIALPVSKDAFKALLTGIDLSTEAGKELYGRLIVLSEGFAEVADKVQESVKALEEQLLDKGTQAFEEFNTALEKVFKSVQSMITKTKNLINSITEKTTEDDLYTRLVKYNKLFDEFALTSSEETYDAILALSQSLADDSDVAPSVLKRLDAVLGSLTEKEQVLRVNIVDGLGELLGLNQAQLQQLQTSVSDGKLTNTELTSLNGLTQVQKDGIVSFAEKSSAFSTEDTLSSLELYAQQQLALFKQDVEKEKVGASSTTFQYGDYVGLQEQIDIAKTLGVSYGTAKPMVESLQALSVSTDLKKDLSSLIGYSGYEFDVNKAAQVESLGKYLDPNIVAMLGTIKAESASNIVTRTQQQAFEAAKSAFLQQLSQAQIDLANSIESIGTLQANYDYWKRKDEGDGEGKKYKPAKDAARAAINNNLANIASLQALIPQLLAEKELKGYYTGGYTGNGGVYDVAGLVHKGEYVLSQNDLRNVGGRSSVEAFVNGRAPSVVVNMDPVVQEIKALKQENENMKQLLVKIAADGTKALNTQRGILDAVSIEEA